MNRLAPLTLRHHPPSHAHPQGPWENLAETDRDPLDDIKLFATTWLAGLVFFGTYLS